MLKNSKLEKYAVFLLSEGHIIKCEIVLAYTKADAVIIFTDKYYKLINTKEWCQIQVQIPAS